MIFVPSSVLLVFGHQQVNAWGWKDDTMYLFARVSPSAQYTPTIARNKTRTHRRSRRKFERQAIVVGDRLAYGCGPLLCSLPCIRFSTPRLLHRISSTQ